MRQYFWLLLEEMNLLLECSRLNLIRNSRIIRKRLKQIANVFSLRKWSLTVSLCQTLTERHSFCCGSLLGTLYWYFLNTLLVETFLHMLLFEIFFIVCLHLHRAWITWVDKWSIVVAGYSKILNIFGKLCGVSGALKEQHEQFNSIN